MLGNYTLSGTTARVTVTNNGTTGAVRADAVRVSSYNPEGEIDFEDSNSTLVLGQGAKLQLTNLVKDSVTGTFSVKYDTSKVTLYRNADLSPSSKYDSETPITSEDDFDLWAVGNVVGSSVIELFAKKDSGATEQLLDSVEAYVDLPYLWIESPNAAQVTVAEGETKAAFVLKRDKTGLSTTELVAIPNINITFQNTQGAVYGIDYEIIPESGTIVQDGDHATWFGNLPVGEDEIQFDLKVISNLFNDSDYDAFKTITATILTGSDYNVGYPNDALNYATDVDGKAELARALISNKNNQKPTIDVKPKEVGIQKTVVVDIGPDRKLTNDDSDRSNVIWNVTGSDPENTKLTFSIVSGNDDGIFKIDPDTGKILLNKELSERPTGKNQYTLELQVSDEDGKYSDVGDGKVTINIHGTSVGVYGDTQAIEGTSNNQIKLTFSRFSASNSGDLKVYFTQLYPLQTPRLGAGTVTLEDFDADSKIALNKGWVIIPNGESKYELILTVINDMPGGNFEGLEEALIFVDKDPAATPSYIPVWDNYNASNPLDKNDKKENYKVKSYAQIEVLDNITLFVDGNPGQHSGQQDPDGNSVHYNDVNQNGMPNCSTMSVILLLAYKYPEFTKRMMEKNPDPNSDYNDFKVQLSFELAGITFSYWDEIKFDLKQGSIQDNELSGDWETSNGLVEIWPNLLAQTVRKHNADDPNMASNKVWKLLTGQNAINPFPPSGQPFVIPDTYSNGDIQAIIDKAIQDGKHVIVGSKKSAPGITGNHAWIIDGNDPSNNNNYRLLNPWGGEDFDKTRLQKNELTKQIDQIFILNPIP